MRIRPSSVLRAAGPAVAVVLPGTGWRSRALTTGGSYVAGSALDPHGIQFLSMSVDDERLPQWANRASQPVSATVSWVLAQQLVVPSVRRLPLPRPLAAALYAAVLYVADDRLAALAKVAVERAAAREAAAAEAASTPATTPATTPESAAAVSG